MILFTYDFEHKKTEHFLLRLLHYKIPVTAAIAAPWVKIDSPEKRYRYHLRHVGMIHPRDLCARFNIPYYACDHNSTETLRILDVLKPEVGLVAGARILSGQVISRFSKGIVNFHPGLIPEARGVDTPHWIIKDKLPLGVTSHWVDTRVDAGRIIIRKPLPVYKDDTIIDFSLRLFEGQLEIFKDTMTQALTKPLEVFTEVPRGAKKSYKWFPPEQEHELPVLFEEYLEEFGEKNDE